MQPLINLLCASALMFGSQATLADEKPPPGAMALSVVLTKLEQQGYTPITDVSLDNEQWVVAAFKEGEKRALEVDPNSGEVLSDQPHND